MNYQCIKNYLEGKTAEIESAQVQEWLKNPENENESRQILGKIWLNSDISITGSTPDFDQMLNHIHHVINCSTDLQKKNVEIQKTGGYRIYKYFTKIAAILFLPLLLISGYFYFSTKLNNERNTISSTREIYTKPGTRTKIELSDGTSVWLNDGTTFRYPEIFTGKNREVYVDGEAYFEVKSNLERPFIVNNPMMKTVVTGTHFNLNAYSADKYFEATLMEGKVSLEKNNQSIIMAPGEQVQFDVQLNQLVQKNIEASSASAWIDGKLIFKDEKLGTAIKKLARWYNIEIILADPKLNDYLLTGTFQDEMLDQTLRLISLAVPVKFEYKKEEPTKIQRIIYMIRK